MIINIGMMWHWINLISFYFKFILFFLELETGNIVNRFISHKERWKELSHRLKWCWILLLVFVFFFFCTYPVFKHFSLSTGWIIWILALSNTRHVLCVDNYHKTLQQIPLKYCLNYDQQWNFYASHNAHTLTMRSIGYWIP